MGGQRVGGAEGMGNHNAVLTGGDSWTEETFSRKSAGTFSYQLCTSGYIYTRPRAGSKSLLLPVSGMDR